MEQKQFEKFINENVRYNCYVLTYGDNNLTYLGTSNFIINNNYYGLLAYGYRNYNYEKKCVEIIANIVSYNTNSSEIKAILKQYEKKLNTSAFNLEINYKMEG